VRSVVSGLRSVSYPLPVAAAGLYSGDPVALLPLLHWCLLAYSPAVRSAVEQLLGCGAEALDDASLAALALRVCRELLRVRPALATAQFLARPGAFVARKLEVVAMLLRGAARMHAEARARAPRMRLVAAGSGGASAEQTQLGGGEALEEPRPNGESNAELAAHVVPTAGGGVTQSITVDADVSGAPAASVDVTSRTLGGPWHGGGGELQRLIAVMEERGRRTEAVLARAAPLLHGGGA